MAVPPPPYPGAQYAGEYQGQHVYNFNGNLVNANGHPIGAEMPPEVRDAYLNPNKAYEPDPSHPRLDPGQPIQVQPGTAPTPTPGFGVPMMEFGPDGKVIEKETEGTGGQGTPSHLPNHIQRPDEQGAVEVEAADALAADGLGSGGGHVVEASAADDDVVEAEAVAVEIDDDEDYDAA